MTESDEQQDAIISLVRRRTGHGGKGAKPSYELACRLDGRTVRRRIGPGVPGYWDLDRKVDDVEAVREEYAPGHIGALVDMVVDQLQQPYAGLVEMIGDEVTDLRGHLTARGDRMLVDGGEAPGAFTLVAEHMMADRVDEDGAAALGLFLKDLLANPSKQAREGFARFIGRTFAGDGDHAFALNPDGSCRGWRSVCRDDDGTLWSAHRGHAFVDGKEYGGPGQIPTRIPNRMGRTVSMPRAEVDADPARICSAGLHVGDWSGRLDASAVIAADYRACDVVAAPEGASELRVCAFTPAYPLIVRGE